MKYYFTISVFLSSWLALAQYDGKFGLTLGATNYITDTNLLSSKSGTGFTIGAMSVSEFNENFTFVLEFNYNYHNVTFVGRENELADPEDLKFNLQEFSIPMTFNYFFYEVNYFKFGINAGPALNFVHEFNLNDASKENYVLDPLYASPSDLAFDTANDEISFNVFAAVGLCVQYDEVIMANLKYYHGLTDPYRQAPIVGIRDDIEGQDSYFTFGLTYFFL